MANENGTALRCPCAGTRRIHHVVVGEKGVDGVQVAVGRFGKVEVHGAALSCVAPGCRLVLVLVGPVAAECTAYDV